MGNSKLIPVEDKVLIFLTPFNAAVLMGLMEQVVEMFNETPDYYELNINAANEFLAEANKRIKPHHMDDIRAQTAVYELLGKFPEQKEQKRKRKGKRNDTAGDIF